MTRTGTRTTTRRLTFATIQRACSFAHWLLKDERPAAMATFDTRLWAAIDRRLRANSELIVEFTAAEVGRRIVVAIGIGLVTVEIGGCP